MGLASGPQSSFTEQENGEQQIPEGPSPALSSYHLSFPITTAEPFSSVSSSFLESFWDLQDEGGWEGGVGRNFAYPRLMSLDFSLRCSASCGRHRPIACRAQNFLPTL